MSMRTECVVHLGIRVMGKNLENRVKGLSAREKKGFTNLMPAHLGLVSEAVLPASIRDRIRVQESSIRVYPELLTQALKGISPKSLIEFEDGYGTGDSKFRAVTSASGQPGVRAFQKYIEGCLEATKEAEANAHLGVFAGLATIGGGQQLGLSFECLFPRSQDLKSALFFIPIADVLDRGEQEVSAAGLAALARVQGGVATRMLLPEPFQPGDNLPLSVAIGLSKTSRGEGSAT